MIAGVQTEVLSGVGEALPAAGIVLGTIAGIMIAVKVFKRISGARA